MSGLGTAAEVGSAAAQGASIGSAAMIPAATTSISDTLKGIETAGAIAGGISDLTRKSPGQVLTSGQTFGGMSRGGSTRAAQSEVLNMPAGSSLLPSSHYSASSLAQLLKDLKGEST